jgi:hypothetical protein
VSTHSALDDLSALAEALAAGDSLPPACAEALEHCAACPACDVVLQRLRAGVSLLDEARAHTPPMPDWEAIDPHIARAAEDTARQIRAGRLRAPSRWREPVVVGFGFAVAAAALLAVRYAPVEAPTEVPVAQGPAAPVEAPVQAAPGVRYEAGVLLSAGGARVAAAASGGFVPVATRTSLAEGARIETTAAGRAVLALGRGWRADVRAASEVALSTLREPGTALRLTEGTVALTPTGDEAPRVALAAGRWTLDARGAMVGTYTQSVLRVVVLSGRVDASTGDGAALQMVGPVVFDLPAVGEAVRRIETASDEAALAPGLLAAEGLWVRVPPLEDGARVTLGTAGALPSALEALRVQTPATLVAETRRGRMVLDVSGTEGLAWRASPTLAHAGPAVPRTTRAARPTPTLAMGGPVATPSAAPSDPGLTAAQQRAMVGRARPRVARCLAICQEQNRCPETLHGAVSLSVDPDGTTTVSRLDPSLEGARRCLEGEARFLHFPGQAQPYVLALPVGAGP